MKDTIINLKDSIQDNIDYLSKHYQTTFDILNEMEVMLKFDATPQLMIQWYTENKTPIETIEELLQIKDVTL